MPAKFAFSASIFPLAVKLPAIDNLSTLILPPTEQRPATLNDLAVTDFLKSALPAILIF